MRRFVTPTLMIALAAAALALPGGARPASAAKEQTNVIRIATLSPRGSEVTSGLKRLDRDIRKATNNQIGIRVYPSGVAGDEKDVVKKMGVGQMDASVVTTTGMGQIAREAVVLNAPGVVTNYKKLDAVKKAMRPQFEKAFWKKGFKLVSWGDMGEYRYFSKKPIEHPNDIKSMRPWLWPESYVMRELWQTIGATGVPLGVPEVYGALQTGMIDMVIATGVSITGLQWHTKLDYLTKETFGVLMGALLVSEKKWSSLPEDGRKTLLEMAQANEAENSKKARKADKAAIVRLLKRGFEATNMSKKAEQDNARIRAKVTQKLTGRVFSKQLLEKVKRIADGAS